MTQEEYEEYERLRQEYNRLVDRRNRLVEEYNRLIVELEAALTAAVAAINTTAAVHAYVMPKLDHSTMLVSEVAEHVTRVREEIDELSAKYFVIKNISTASKKLTQLNDEYQRNFGLYNYLRRVTLGYVVGVDKHIVSNEKLRETAEKTYLQNADYWIAHCLMATMLWVNDEKEAAERAVDKAMQIDPRKSSLFFLLVNLHFGRSDAAALWFEYYLQDIDVGNIGDEIRILLQAYLYNICGSDPAFRVRIRDAFDRLLTTVKNESANYDAKVQRSALEFISASVHRTVEEFSELSRTCTDYPALLAALSSAEKNGEFARYFEALYAEDSDAPKDMTERIQNVLYDLINAYDEAELVIIRDMDRNEMILKARGDLAAAQAEYDVKYRPERPQTMGDLMVKLAFPSGLEEVDVRVRKFAVAFLCESILSAFARYREQYQRSVGETHQVNLGAFTVAVSEREPQKASQELAELYKKNRGKFIRRDRTVKTLAVTALAFLIVWIGCLGFSVYSMAQGDGWPPVLITLFALSFLSAVGFTVWMFLRIRRVSEDLEARRDKDLKRLEGIVRAIGAWRAKFTAADAESAALIEVLNKFKLSEEVGK